MHIHWYAQVQDKADNKRTKKVLYWDGLRPPNPIIQYFTFLYAVFHIYAI